MRFTDFLGARQANQTDLQREQDWRIHLDQMKMQDDANKLAKIGQIASIAQSVLGGIGTIGNLANQSKSLGLDAQRLDLAKSGQAFDQDLANRSLDFDMSKFNKSFGLDQLLGMGGLGMDAARLSENKRQFDESEKRLTQSAASDEMFNWMQLGSQSPEFFNRARDYFTPAAGLPEAPTGPSNMDLLSLIAGGASRPMMQTAMDMRSNPNLSLDLDSMFAPTNPNLSEEELEGYFNVSPEMQELLRRKPEKRSILGAAYEDFFNRTPLGVLRNAAKGQGPQDSMTENYQQFLMYQKWLQEMEELKRQESLPR